MVWLIVKYVLTSAVVVAVSEFARRSDRLGGLLAALPMAAHGLLAHAGGMRGVDDGLLLADCAAGAALRH